MNTRMLWIQGALYTIIAMLMPVSTFLAGDSEATPRAISAVVVFAIISGATALKAFLSTTFSDSKYSDADKPSINSKG